MHCFIDYRTSNEEIVNLLKLDLDPILVPKTSYVYEAINGHVDIQLNIIDYKSRLIIVQKDIDKNFLEILSRNNINYLLSKNSLDISYPKDIILNGLILKDYFIHNTNFTDDNLLMTQKNKKIIHINQGYSKCSILPIADNAFITNDKGIFNALDKEIFDILLIPPGDILLPSLDYGFIGGTGGMITPGKLALFGELKHYKYGDEIYKFLYKYDIEPISLKKGKLIDRGSLLCI